MSASTRIRVVVAVCALAAAGVAVGAAALQSQHGDTASAQDAKARSGYPPLSLDLGARTDTEATALRRASALYDAGHYALAARAFAAFPNSVEARVGEAFATWPDGGLRSIERLGREQPGSALVLLNLGLGRFWAGRDGEAAQAWQSAVQVQPDSMSAVRADSLLHPKYLSGLPQFVPSFGPPASLASLSASAQLAALRQRAANGTWRDRVLYGVALQRLGRPLSARHWFALAAAQAPNEAEAQVAKAVGLFDKSRPARAFGTLGPLTKRFPGDPTVRFHLGLMLVWLGQVDQATKELRLAVAEGPKTPIGRVAAAYLARIEQAQKG